MAKTTTVRNTLENRSLENVIRNPRLTEKATMLTAGNVYTFDVTPQATKVLVKQAIKHIYGFDPVAVRMITISKKQVTSRRRRGETGTKGGGKKALVQLKEGDRIEFV